MFTGAVFTIAKRWRQPKRLSAVSVCVLTLSVVSDSFQPSGLCPLGFSIHGIFQERILEWVEISYSRGLPWPRDWTCISCISSRCFITVPPRKPVHQQVNELTICSIYIFSHNKEWNSDIYYNWTNLEDIMLSEISQIKGQILYDFPYMKYLE